MEAKQAIDDFILMAGYVLRTQLTPLQRYEISEAREAHIAATSNLSSCNLQVLQQQRDNITARWEILSSTFMRNGFAMQRLHLFALSFAGLLWAEYTNADNLVKYICMRSYLKILGSSSQREEAAKDLTKGNVSRLDSLYDMTVNFAIKELCLDPTHINRRLRVAAEEQRLVHAMLRDGDTVNLRETIEKDRLALDVLTDFRGELGDIRKDVLAAMKRLLMQPALSSIAASSAREGVFGGLMTALGLRQRSASATVPASLREALSEEILRKKND